jgi:hypothetical protein
LVQPFLKVDLLAAGVTVTTLGALTLLAAVAALGALTALMTRTSNGHLYNN